MNTHMFLLETDDRLDHTIVCVECELSLEELMKELRELSASLVVDTYHGMIFPTVKQTLNAYAKHAKVTYRRPDAVFGDV